MTQTESVAKIPAASVISHSSDRVQKGAATQAAAQAAVEAAKESHAKVVDAVRKLADVVSASNTELSFSVDDSTNEVVIKVTDSNTGKVIRQIPSDEMLRIARNVREMLGLIYDHKG